MRICLLADFSSPDEARKVIAHNLLIELSKNNEIKPLNVQEIFSTNFWKEIHTFDADIVHYIPGASTMSFLITRIAKFRTKNAKTIMFSSLDAFNNFSHGFYYIFSTFSKRLIPFMKTDLILVQSNNIEKTFIDLGCDVEFFVLSGVDIEKFCPVSKQKKEELRKKYGIPIEKFVILHVGSVRKWRNVEILKDIQNNDRQVILVGRVSTRFEKDILSKLEMSGVKIINEYVQKLEELYALSDCYIFPTTDPLGSIDIPLSVLEAMATNIPVISTRFGGLPRIFNGNGLIFTDVENFDQKIKEIKDNHVIVNTRDLVLYYSWENIAKRLEVIYEELLYNN